MVRGLDSVAAKLRGGKQGANRDEGICLTIGDVFGAV